MKMSEFKTLIREEIKKVLKENASTKSTSKVLKENAMKDIKKYFMGTRSTEGTLSDLVQDGLAELPERLQDEYDDATFRRGPGKDVEEDFIDEMQFYVKYAKYFDPKVVDAAKMILDKIESGNNSKLNKTEKDFIKYFKGELFGPDGVYDADIESSLTKMPNNLQKEWEKKYEDADLNDLFSYTPVLEFYVKNKQYFSNEIVKKAAEILKNKQDLRNHN